MSVALLIIVAFLVLAVGLALRARRGRDMDLEQWTAGGRGFGALFVFLLMAGEIYSTFTFLGGAGLVYGSGGAAYYILGYGTLAYILSYWLLPAVWRYATPRKLLSQADVFVSQYDSRALGVIVSLVAVAAMIPYLALQLKGLGIIVSSTSSGSISSTAAVWIGAVVLSTYVVASGVHGSAWTAAIKDLLTLSVVVFIGLYLPIHYFGSIGAMFHQVQDAKPGFVGLSGSAGMLCALVPGSMLLIASATIVARNIYRGLNPSVSDATVTTLTKLLVPVISLGAVAFVFAGGQTIVTLLLLGYALVTQVFPALLLSLVRPGWVTRAGAISGIVVGVAVVAAMTFSGATPGTSTTLDSLVGGLPAFLAQLNLGVVALAVNFVVTGLVSVATRGAAPAEREPVEEEPRFTREPATAREGVRQP